MNTDRALLAFRITGGRYGATLWQARPGAQQLAAKARLTDCAGALHAVLWRGDRLAAVEAGRLRVLQLADGAMRVRGWPWVRVGWGQES